MRTPSHIAQHFPRSAGKEWPTGIGAPPSPAALTVARASGELGTAVSMALAMRARTADGKPNGPPYGATGPEISAAVLFATGATTGKHGNKFRELVYTGRYVVTGGNTSIKGSSFAGAHIPPRGGIQPVAIDLPRRTGSD
jgi:hypothetical protein